MFGLRKRKRKGSFFDVFKEFFKLKEQGKELKGKTIEGWNVFPSSPFSHKKDKAEIHIYFTDGTRLILNTIDFDIEVTLIKDE